ncbi:2',3'-cyclic-nucleotide 2'-phosphodiesterase (5'-nucleotidase family) [Hymenobacter luteus]|uniref:2',3'-cyclic-nucleotide 2'-phosphodiesterase (5'-nucleotidase family) n=2 Tax=Hymenobacter TaxID=89966 RepID=A0A7W9T557_9BACT|nr:MULTISPECIES: bifunctional UDP-sugar hydrolase/5'-nucleotidase [Hymenobacter]MBB4603403.1 2',3'-cyclic-nucleotide 2'-phosphodiesterase (5'-nucleotidase family) [Hymenobacter latericoloratus]MBB6061243.1 2',3'-cyclic-nucleotide 2'-phosphodiesterase (5'-nucleotidase family) [Hymenobacter luteus]
MQASPNTDSITFPTRFLAPWRWLALGSAVLAAAGTLSSCQSNSRQGVASASGSFTILHTNDIHGRHRPFTVSPGNATAQTGDPGRSPSSFERAGRVGGFAHLATAVQQVRQARGAANVLLLDGGDTFSDDLLGNLTKGAANIKLMNALGYQFMALGNHDFDYGTARTRELQQLAHFPMRGANVTDRATGQPFLGEPAQVFTVGGVRVGVLALAYHNTAQTGNPDNTKELAFGSGIEAARRYVPALRARADVVVILSHQGTKVDERLAREVPGIDLIVGAHSHDRIAPPRQVGNAWVVQALSDAAVLGQLTVQVKAGKITSVEGIAPTLWTTEYPAYTKLAQLVDSLRAPHKARLEEVLATATGRIGRQYKSASPFDQLAGELLREATGAELAFLPGVGYGVSLEPGPITREMLYTLLPHPSKVVTLALTGAQVRQLLEQTATNQNPGNDMARVGGLLQTSGLNWTADLILPVSRRVSDVRVNGQPLDAQRRYRVVTHSGMLTGIHRYTTFAQGTNVLKLDKGVTEVVEAALRKRGTVAPPTPARVHIVTAK